MTLKIALFENHLTPVEDDCFAIVQDKDVVTQIDLIKTMTGRGLSLTDTDCGRVVNELGHAIRDSLLEGKAIEMALMTITPVVKGTFINSDDVYDPERHTIEFKVKLGDSLDVDVSQIPVVKVKPTTKTPMILIAEDRFSDTTNQTLTPNGTLVIQGQDLKVNTEASDEGLFFKINNADTRAERYHHNTDSKLEVKVPASLTAGATCNLEIRKRYKGNKKLFVFTYNIDFIVAGA